MTLYAVGDIQGCASAFTKLLDAISFAPETDRLWLVGDLVNRGPDSLGVLREVMNLGASVTTVLGNHDLHLLAAAAGVRPAAPTDTFHAVLAAPDAGNILDWLRSRPLLHRDTGRRYALVHAGLAPTWSVAEAEALANEVCERLAGSRWVDLLKIMYGDEPRRWTPHGPSAERSRFIINALTRMRFCDADANLDFGHTGPPGSQPPHLMPWFEFPSRPSRDTHIVFGHWAALGLLRRENLTGLDSGCVWGGSLTALPLDPAGEPVSVSCAPT